MHAHRLPPLEHGKPRSHTDLDLENNQATMLDITLVYIRSNWHMAMSSGMVNK